MGLFKLKELNTKEKSFYLSVDMNSSIEVVGLPALAKYLLWVDENVPNTDRRISIDTAYWDDNKYTIHVKWKEQRGGNEIDDVR